MTPTDRDCRAIADDISALLDGELSSADAARVQRHLDACAACRETAAALRGVVTAVAALPRKAAPAGLADAVGREIAAHGAAGRAADFRHAAAGADAAPTSLGVRRTHPLAWAVRITAAAAVIVGGVFVSRTYWGGQVPAAGLRLAGEAAEPLGGNADGLRDDLRIARHDAADDGVRMGIVDKAPSEMRREIAAGKPAAPASSDSAKKQPAPGEVEIAKLKDADIANLPPGVLAELKSLGYVGDDPNAEKDTGFLDQLSAATRADQAEELARVLAAAQPAEQETPVRLGERPAAAAGWPPADTAAPAPPWQQSAVVEVVCTPQSSAEYEQALNICREMTISNRLVQQSPAAVIVGGRMDGMGGEAVGGGGARGKTVHEGRDAADGRGGALDSVGGEVAKYRAAMEPAATSAEYQVSPELANLWVNNLANNAPQQVIVRAPAEVSQLIQNSEAYNRRQLVLVNDSAAPASNSAADRRYKYAASDEAEGELRQKRHAGGASKQVDAGGRHGEESAARGDRPATEGPPAKSAKSAERPEQPETAAAARRADRQAATPASERGQPERGRSVAGRGLTQDFKESSPASQPRRPTLAGESATEADAPKGDDDRKLAYRGGESQRDRFGVAPTSSPANVVTNSAPGQILLRIHIIPPPAASQPAKN